MLFVGFQLKVGVRQDIPKLAGFLLELEEELADELLEFGNE